MSRNQRQIARITELEAALDRAKVELIATHYPEWASVEAKASGKEPIGCVICGSADGSWPCVSRMVAADLRSVLEDDTEETM